MRVMVTGSGRGIGLALAECALRAGHEVEAVYRSPTLGLTDLTRRWPTLSTLRLDLADRTAEDRLRQWQANLPLDLLINNAGLYSLDRRPYDVSGQRLDSFDRDQALSLYLVNSVTPVEVTRRCGGQSSTSAA